MAITRTTIKSAPTRTAETTRCSKLQHAIANRARIVLSLCDQRADVPLSLPVVAEGMSRYLERADYQEHSMVSRLLRARRNWKPDHLLALCQYAAEHRVDVDAGWLSFGNTSEAPAPIVPADCELRAGTVLEGLTRSPLTLRQLRTREQRAKG